MKLLILGGGISGLSAAWYLRKKYPNSKITLLEKTDRLGGAIRTTYQEGFLFERGPRTFQVGRSPRLLNLIREVGLEGDLVFSKGVSSRYLWEGGSLRPISSFLPKFLFSFLKEPFIASSTQEDESIYDFASRRFGCRVAETLFDPMTLGIYAGDIRKLSIKSCFPQFFQWEKEKRSCMRALLSSFFHKTDRTLFTLKKGMESLIYALANQSDIDILLQTQVEAIENTKVIANGKCFDADLIFSALPGSVLASLCKISFPMNEKSLWIANLCYSSDVLSRKGFGYLVPSKEGLDLLGMIWDSSIFPDQNGAGKTCLTAMMKKENLDGLKKALQDHLSIFEPPSFMASYTAEKAIPQFEVGYANSLSQFKKTVREKYPHVTLLGNYLRSPSVESCILK